MMEVPKPRGRVGRPPKKHVDGTARPAKASNSASAGWQDAGMQRPYATDSDRRHGMPMEPPQALPVNHDFCDCCAVGGNLLCCDFCPMAFHFDCLNPPVDPLALREDEPWHCNQCAPKVIIEERTRAATAHLSNSNVFVPLVRKLLRQNPLQFTLDPDIICANDDDLEESVSSADDREEWSQLKLATFGDGYGVKRKRTEDGFVDSMASFQDQLRRKVVRTALQRVGVRVASEQYRQQQLADRSNSAVEDTQPDEKQNVAEAPSLRFGEPPLDIASPISSMEGVLQLENLRLPIPLGAVVSPATVTSLLSPVMMQFLAWQRLMQMDHELMSKTDPNG